MPRIELKDWLTPEGKILSDHWPIDEVYHKGLQKWFRRKPWFLKRKYLGWAIAKGLVVMPMIPQRKHRGGRRRHRRHVRVLACRFRDTNPTISTTGEVVFGSLGSGVPIGVIKRYSNGVVQSTQNVHIGGDPANAFQGKKTWDCVHPGPPYRDVGAFSKIEYNIPSRKLWNVGTVSSLGKPGVTELNKRTYTGSFYEGGNWGSDQISNYTQLLKNPPLTGYDTIAFDKLKPQVSPGNLSQFLYELKDLPRMLETSANALWNSYRSFGGGYSKVTMHPRSVADNFLNHEFGWAPFLSDIQKLCSLYQESEKYIANLIHSNNTWQRRYRVLEETDDDSLIFRIYGPNTNPAFGSDLNNMCESRTIDGIPCFGLTDIRRRVTTRVWAVGHFKYYRPEFDDTLVNFSSQLMNIRRLMTLYGLRINPTVVWKLTPWSWAVDWFTQFGSFIQHHDESINDGLVARDVQVMRSSLTAATKTITAFFYSGAKSFNWQRSLDQKQRVLADSPYGFDRPWSGLSPKQIGILGAIGITRSSDGFISRG
jgi:hypothetical protein